jgi:hypothetical protein
MRTQSRSVAPSDSAISFMLRKAWRIRASSPGTRVSVAGSIPRMPAMKTKSPARAATSQVPVGLIAPGGDSVSTPFGDCAAAGAMAARSAITASVPPSAARPIRFVDTRARIPAR